MVRGTAVMAASSIAGQGLLIAASPLLTRIYSPSDVGVAAVFAAVVGIALNFSGLRYEVALQLPADDGEAANVLGVSLVAVIVTSAAVAVLLWIGGSWAAGGIGAEALARYLWLIPVGLLGGGMYRALSAWAVRIRDYGLIARTGVVQKVLQVIAQLGVGVGVAGPLGLIVGSIVGSSGGVGALARSAVGENRAALLQISPQRMRIAAARYRRFALISAPVGTVGGLALLGAPILLATLYGPVVAGWFGLTNRVVSLPAMLIGTAVATAYLGNAAELARTDPAHVRALFWRTARHLTALAVVPVTALAVLAPWLFSVVFGEEWREAGIYARALAPMVFAEFVTGPVAQTLLLFGRLDLQVIAVGSRLALGLGILWAAHELGASATWALTAYALGMTVSLVTTFALNARLLRLGVAPGPSYQERNSAGSSVE